MAQIFTNQAPNVGLPGGTGVRNSDFEGTITLSDNMQAGQYVSGSLDFRLANQGAGWNAEKGLGYFLRVNEYNANDQLIAQTIVIPFRIIYYPGSGSCSAQWNSGKMFNWGIGSGWSQARPMLKGGSSEWGSLSYSGICQYIQATGAQTGSYGGFINPEPMLVRYASDNLSGRRNIYTPVSKAKAGNWSSANPYRGSSTPSGGGRPNDRAAVPFGWYLNGNTSYINFDCAYYSANQATYRTTITWPSQSDAKVDPGTHVNNASHIFRHNGSNFNPDSVAYYFNGSGWSKGRVYRYNGSSWTKI